MWFFFLSSSFFFCCCCLFCFVLVEGGGGGGRGEGVFRDRVLWACSWLPRRCDSVCVTTCDQSECVICRVIFALGKSLFQRWIWWKFRFLQACVGDFDTIPPWTVVGTYYLDSSYVTFKYFDFLSVSDKLELLGHVHEPPWWFESRGGGDSHMKQTGMLVGNLEFNP